MPRPIAEAIAAAVAALLATILFILGRDQGARWAGTLSGHLVGVAGLGLMLWAGFGYSRRKRRQAAGAPAMASAMRTHIIAGLLGPYLVILHSGLAFRGVAGVLALLVVVVAASGVVGRALLGLVPRQVTGTDPVRAALLDAEMARLEVVGAEAARRGDQDAAGREALRVQLVALRHEEELLRSEWRQTGAAVTWRRLLSGWWLLHVPLSLVLWVVAAVHVVATLYYATLGR